MRELTGLIELGNHDAPMKESCRRTDERLTPYADDALPAAERRRSSGT
jgi:hypothetical protein